MYGPPSSIDGGRDISTAKFWSSLNLYKCRHMGGGGACGKVESEEVGEGRSLVNTRGDF